MGVGGDLCVLKEARYVFMEGARSLLFMSANCFQKAKTHHTHVKHKFSRTF